MDKQVKQEWTEALRFGDYDQTIGTLNGPRGYCCLGVLCEITDQGAWEEFGKHSNRYRYNGSKDVDILPEKLAADVGLEEQDPSVQVEDDSGKKTHVHLSTLNDGQELWEQHSFEEIADLIEENF